LLATGAGPAALLDRGGQSPRLGAAPAATRLPVTGLPDGSPIDHGRGTVGTVSTRTGLARGTLRGPALWVMDISASAPMTVLAGAVVTTFAATGLVGVPLAFLVLTAALWLLT